MTTWLPVRGFEGAYEVSDDGRVRSLDRVVPDARWGSHRVPGRELKPSATRGYLRLSLSIDGRRRMAFVHALVLEAFVEPRPLGLQACHANGNPSDNRVANLRWDTPSGNMRDCLKHGTHAQVVKTHCPHGHPYDDENTRVRPDGSRLCKACHRERARRGAGAA